MGEAGEGKNITHQQKKLGEDALRDVPRPLPHPDPRRPDRARRRSTSRAEDSPELRYMHERRKALGGYLPRAAQRRAAARGRRRSTSFDAAAQGLGRARDVDHDGVRAHARPRCCATRRSASASCRSSPTRRARSAWRACSASSASTRRRASSTSRSTHDQVMYYREDQKGQILAGGHQRGGRALVVDRGGHRATRTTACRMMPFFIFYSMFGFQRVGDLIWAAADYARARLPARRAPSGRTTLAGEGLQHQDGHSHVLAATVPNCRRLRPDLRLRARGDRARRHAPHVRRAGETSSTTSR